MSGTGWEYTLVDEPEEGVEAWAQGLHDQGWRLWHPSGTRVRVNDREVTRWSLRRPTPARSSTPKPPVAGSEASR